jgi:hypothetical protein
LSVSVSWFASGRLPVVTLGSAVIGRVRRTVWKCGESAHAAPVIVDGRPLFRVVGISFIRPKRAGEIAERIGNLAEDLNFPVDELRVQEADEEAHFAGEQRVVLLWTPTRRSKAYRARVLRLRTRSKSRRPCSPTARNALPAI